MFGQCVNFCLTIMENKRKLHIFIYSNVNVKLLNCMCECVSAHINNAIFYNIGLTFNVPDNCMHYMLNTFYVSDNYMLNI